jgi:hypothetical protein
MYRDVATALDEHDRAVGAILISETLVAHYERAAAQFADTAHTTSSDRWRAAHDAQDTYLELWRQLDRAKRLLDRRGANTTSYDELRPHVVPMLAIKHDAHALDLDVLDDARRAIEQLKLAVPGADWNGIDKRTHALVHQPQLRRRHRMATTGVVLGVLTFVTGLFHSIQPGTWTDKDAEMRAQMRREIADIATERKTKIAALGVELGDRCAPALAREYVKQLAMDGRRDVAIQFADGYTFRCGADPAIQSWTKVRAKPLPVAASRPDRAVDSVSSASVRREREDRTATASAKVSLRLD